MAQVACKENTPLNGEGVYSFLERNHFNSDYFDEFVELNDSKLSQTNELLIDLSYTLPACYYKPRKGDNISSFLRRFDLEGDYYLSLFKKLNEERLIATQYRLLLNEEYLIPRRVVNDKINVRPSDASLFVPLLNEHVDIVDHSLSNAVFYIVSGHGGLDPGAVSYYDGNILCEDEYAYDVGIRLFKKMIQHGATVYMITRDYDDGIRDQKYLGNDKDEVCYVKEAIHSKQLDRLKQRVRVINTSYKQHSGKKQVAIMLHIDASSQSDQIDVYFYHSSRSTSGKLLANDILKTFKSKYEEHQPNRGYKGIVSSRELYMVRKTHPTAVYIELGNIKNSKDQKRILDPNNREALANWLFEGISNNIIN